MTRTLHSFETLAYIILALSGASLVFVISQRRAEAFYNQGRHELSVENYVQALYNFQKAIDSKQKQPMFYAAHATAAANQLFGIAIPPQSWSNLPQFSQADQLRLRRAAEDYENALKLSENDATFLSNLGWIEATLDNKDAALTAFRRAVLADPNDAISRIGLGLFYERLGSDKEAIEQYAHSLVASARIVDSPFFKDLQIRNPRASMVVIDRALEILGDLPQSPIIVASIAKLHAYQGQNELADREYNSVLSKLPNLSYTWANLGLLHLLQGRRQAASIDFQRALFLDEQNTLAMSKLAFIEFEGGDMNAAKVLYARTLLTPQNSIHAERTWRIYHVLPVGNDDIVPAGLLYYISPTIEPLDFCDDGWLIRLSGFGGRSMQARSNIRMQENFCNSHY